MNFKDVDLFLTGFNDKCEAFIAFEEELIKQRDIEIGKVTEESEKLLSDMQDQLNKYIEINFCSIKKKIEEEIRILTDNFNDEYENVAASCNCDSSSFEEVKEYLKQVVLKFNGLIEKLNKEDLNAKIEKQSIYFKESSFEVVRGSETSTFRSSSDKVSADEKIALSGIDKELIAAVFTTAKEIYATVDRLIGIYKINFDFNGFKVEVTSKKKAYIDEINSDTASKIDAEFYDKFQKSEVSNTYFEFFEELDAEAKNANPDIRNGSNEFLQQILLGYVRYCAIKKAGYMDYVAKCEPLATRIDNAGYMNVPLIADLNTKGNILIHTDEKRYSDALKQFVNRQILGMLLSFPCKRIHFEMIDVNNKMGFASFAALTKISDNILLDGIIRDEKQLDDAIDNIKRIKYSAEDRLGAEGLTKVFDYNAKFETAPMDVYVFVLVDFPAKISLSLAEKVRDIAINGKDDGIFTILVNNKSIDPDYNFPQNEYEDIVKEIEKFSYVFKDEADNIKFISSDGIKYDLESLSDINISDMGTIVEILKANAEVESSKAIPLSDMFAYIDKTPAKSISVEMDIPFGQSGGDVQTLRLTNQSGPHAALIGTSGSGKSVLFHTLILDACYKYAPDELNIYLLDFKGGVEFKYYQNHKLPHIKVIGLTNDLNDGLSILASINNEITKRKEMFNSVGVSNIESYYKEGKKIPRLFVIIDEIQEILIRDEKIGEKALNILSEILAIGRSFGVNVLWGSQSVPHISGIQPKIMQNITNRICLKVANSDYAMTLFGDSQALRAVDNLNRPGIKGLGVIKDERTGSGVREFRVAYSEEGVNRTAYVDKILEKWKDVRNGADLYVIGNDLVPDEKKDPLYSGIVRPADISNKAFESYRLSIGADYVTGADYPIGIFNSKERENVLMVGKNVDLLRDMMGYSLLSVVLNRLTDKDCMPFTENKIFYANKEGLNPKYTSDLFNEWPREAEEQIEKVGNGDRFFECIRDQYCLYLERKEAFENGEIPQRYYATYTFIHSLQYISDLFEENRPMDESDFYSLDDDQVRKCSITFNEAFNILLNKGSQYGIHFIISINSVDSIREIGDALRSFNYKIATYGADAASFEDMPLSNVPAITNDRTALLVVNGEMNKIRPYRYDESSDESKQWLKGLLKKI